jgi:ATP-dependent RNA helicase DHX8/PRP22
MFAMLKRASKLRPALRVLITSATLDGEKFARYFGECPLIRCPGRQYPVDISWEPTGSSQRNNTGNIARAVAEAVVRLHMGEQEGHILGFLTGQDEVSGPA